tara:strand:- start:149 stop:496 length:348 start_codon:yes stop_codon:yes gene_type:complete
MNNKSINSQTIIAEDVQIDGDIALTGNITIYGEIRGSVSTDGAIQLAKKGKIFGDVKASTIQINGYIQGDVFINGPAELLSKCELVGDLKYKILTIQDGAQFSGRCEIMEDDLNL